MSFPSATRKKDRPAGIAGLLFYPSDLEAYGNLLLFAEAIVQGFFSGRHRSLDFGSNAEFAEFKAYQEGDPVSDVDWKVYARNRKLMVRKHRDEKEMAAWLLVDVSGSMAYRGDSSREPKGVRAARLAAVLAALMQRQGDKFSITLFTRTIHEHIPPGGTRRHLMDCLRALEERMRQPRGKTSTGFALDLCAPLFKRRGSLIVISDFLSDLDHLFSALSRFQHRGFDILLLHVIDPDERVLPNVPAAKFVDMESDATVDVTPDEVRAAYRREMDGMMERMESECTRRGIEWQPLPTETPWREAMEAWLAVRARNRQRSAR